MAVFGLKDKIEARVPSSPGPPPIAISELHDELQATPRNRYIAGYGGPSNMMLDRQRQNEILSWYKSIMATDTVSEVPA